MYRGAGFAALVLAVGASPALAQDAKSGAAAPVGQGNEYRNAPPFPSQRDGQLWLRKIVVLDPKSGQRAELNVLSNSPVPNPGKVAAARTGSGSDAAARVGRGSEYADAPPFPSQNDETFLVRELTLIDPITGASQTVRVLSNTPVPNPGQVPARKAD